MARPAHDIGSETAGAHRRLETARRQATDFFRRTKAGVRASGRDMLFRIRHRPPAFCSRATRGEAGFPHAWSEYETRIRKRADFADLNDTRLHNMQRAASLIDGLVIESGGIFHFWRVVGQPGRRNGFRVGPTIVNGTLTRGYGGGLCQISSTLFNVFLEAGLAILERSNHSIDAHGEERFIALGRDAAVAYGYKDLIVRNQHAVPLRVSLVLVDEAVVRAGIYAGEPRPFKVTINEELVERYAPAGPSGKWGWKVRVRRFIGSPSGSAEPSYESVDVYRPCNE